MKAKIVYGRSPLKRFYLDDVEVTEEEFHAAVPTRVGDLLKAGKPPDGHRPACWPATSWALSVHPKQVKEANARAKRHGIAVRYDATGKCHLSGKGARRDLMRLEGMHDNEGCYGD